MTLTGKLLFYSEDRGGAWAFQDDRYMSLTSPTNFGVDAERRVYDVNDRQRCGTTSDVEVFSNEGWLSLPDPIINDPDYKISSLYRGEELGDLAADKRLTDRYNFTIKYAAQRLNEEYGADNWKLVRGVSNVILRDGTLLDVDASPTTEPRRPYGIPQNGITRVTVTWDDGEVEYRRESPTLLVEQWDYKGLHILRDGNRLKILSPVDNSKVWEGLIELAQYDLPPEGADQPSIKSGQKGVSRSEWLKCFFDNYPAQLEV